VLPAAPGYAQRSAYGVELRINDQTLRREGEVWIATATVMRRDDSRLVGPFLITAKPQVRGAPAGEGALDGLKTGESREIEIHFQATSTPRLRGADYAVTLAYQPPTPLTHVSRNPQRPVPLDTRSVHLTFPLEVGPPDLTILRDPPPTIEIIDAEERNVRVKLQVKNIGTGNSPRYMLGASTKPEWPGRRFIQCEARFIEGDRLFPELAPGEVHNVCIEWFFTPKCRGQRFVATVTVDDPGRIREADEKNNEWKDDFHIPAPPELRIKSCTLDEPDGRWVTTAAVISHSDSPLPGEFVVTATPEDDGRAPTGEGRLRDLKPGSTPVELSFKVQDEMRGKDVRYTVTLTRHIGEQEPTIDTKTVQFSFPGPERRPDLAVDPVPSAVERGDVVVVQARLENVGTADSPPFLLNVQTTPPWPGPVRTRLDGVSRELPAKLPGLAAEDHVRMVVEFGIVPRARGRDYEVTIDLDTEKVVPELSESNNSYAVAFSVSPPPDTDVTEMWPAAIVAVVAVVAIVGLVALARARAETGVRLKWQAEAREEEPPGQCTPCTYYCRKVELELEPSRRKVTDLTLRMQESATHAAVESATPTSEVVERLNSAILARRRGKAEKQVEALLGPVTSALVDHVVAKIRFDAPARDADIAAQLEGGKLTCKFVLYHCERVKGESVWQEEKEWTATLTDKSEFPIAALRSLTPTEGLPDTVGSRVQEGLLRLLTDLAGEPR
jgi:hypothetical protein